MTYPTKSETPKAATNGVSSEKTSSSKKDTFMNDSIIPAKFDFHGHNVRIVMRDGEPWFVASDICKALGYRDTEKGTRNLGIHQKGTHPMRTPGGTQTVTIINESGLYRLVLRSRKPEAEAFSDWVTSEVLPSIRKTGSYQIGQQQELSIENTRPSHEIEIGHAIDATRSATLKFNQAVLAMLLAKDAPLHIKALVDIDFFTSTPKVNLVTVDPKAVTIPLERFHEVIYNTITVKPETLTKLIKACSDRLGEMATPLLSQPRLEPELRQRAS